VEPNILWVSSARLTPPIAATSLMSSSPLQQNTPPKYNRAMQRLVQITKLKHPETKFKRLERKLNVDQDAENPGCWCPILHNKFIPMPTSIIFRSFALTFSYILV
jgi:hypothetical protein